MADPNQFVPLNPQRTVDYSPRPSLGQAINAEITKTFSAAAYAVDSQIYYGTQVQDGYDAWGDMEGYKEFASHLIHATSPEHMSFLKRGLDVGMEARQTLADASGGNVFVSSLLNPINAIAIPFAGPAAIGSSALKSTAVGFARTAAGVATIETGAELVLGYKDPLRSFEEQAMNVISATVFGGAIGGALSGSAAKVYNKTKLAHEDYFQTVTRLERIENLTPEAIAVPRAERPLGNVSTEDLLQLARVFDDKAEAQRKVLSDPNLSDASRAKAEDSLNSALEQSQYHKNELGIRDLNDLGFDVNNKWSIVENAFTKSAFFKAISTPMKRTLMGKYPNMIKEMFVRSYNDSGMALALNSVNIPTPNSVFQRIGVANGRWVTLHDELVKIWGKDTQIAVLDKLDINLGDTYRKATFSDNTYSKWLTRINEKRIRGDAMSDAESQAANLITEYFSKAQKRLEETGQISNKAGLDSRIARLETELMGLQEKLRTEKLRKDNRSKKTIPVLQARVKEIETRINVNRGRRIALDNRNVEGGGDLIELSGKKPDSSVDELFFPRFWDKRAIKKNREEFGKRLFDWFKKHPYVDEYDAGLGKSTRIVLSDNDADIMARVDKTIDRILGDEDPTSLEAAGLDVGMLPQAGRSKHFRHRNLDIPNNLVLEFMHTDPLAAIRTYAARIEPRYEYAKEFGKDVDSVMFDMRLEMIASGYSTKEINKVMKDYRHMYDRIVGTLHREPSTVVGKLERGMANFLREAASFSYMGSAGLSAIPDFGRIVLEYDLESIAKGMQEIVNKNNLYLPQNEIRKAGEAIDILKGLANMRITEDLSNNIDSSAILNGARNAFYTLNGLAPLTGIAKQLAGIIDGHTIIDYSKRYSALTKMEKTWLARHGIGAEDAAAIAKQPVQTMDSGLYVANTDGWADEALVTKYRVALNSNIMNVIMNGTPADKPIITDGVAYIPMNVAGKFGMVEDANYPGYARVASGFMGLPFQFYSYTLANVNKTIGAIASGQVKNRAIGITTMLSLAYLSLSIRTPDYIWDEMDWRDKFARSFDTSGVAALYSDLFYTSMHTTLALAGPNITNGFISPKFPQEPSTMDAIGGFAGAGPSWGLDMMQSVNEMINGNFGEGAKDAVRALPFMRNYFIKDDVNQLTRGWGS